MACQCIWNPRLALLHFENADFWCSDRVHGVSPAVKILASFIGTQAVKRALFAFDEVEKEAAHGVDTLSDAYWAGFQNHLNLRQSPVNFLRNVSIVGASHAR